MATGNDRRWGERDLAAAWAQAAERMGEMDVAAVLAVTAGDALDPVERATIELQAGRADVAERLLGPDDVPAPDGDRLRWEDVLRLAVATAQGDERARVRLLAVVPRQGPAVQELLLPLVATAAEQAGLDDVATDAWQRVAAVPPGTTPALARAAAADLRQRGRRFAAPLAAELASALCDDVDQEVAVARTRATVARLVASDDRVGAAMLLAAVRWRLAPDPRLATLRAAVGPRMRWRAIAAGSVAAALLAALTWWFTLTGGMTPERAVSGSLALVLAVGFPFLTTVPGAHLVDALSLRLLDLGLVDPDRTRVARARAAGKDTARGLRTVGLVLLALVTAGPASGAVARAAATPGSLDAVTTVQWTVTPLAALAAVTLTRLVRHRIWSSRMLRRRRRSLAALRDETTRCRCWTTQSLRGAAARLYAEQHLVPVPGGTSRAVASALPAGSLVAACTTTARHWLVTTDPAGDATLALAGPAGEPPTRDPGSEIRT
ncbi:hypothetical protein LFM56_17125 [Cellulomonas iranensis]|uniref:hypothetical protein n=1 Tax=Cellulomonas iranensis TaxID=76862 RepID=UPI001CF10B5E|nr:hypothetical protein [Cellulomonas iranensis]UCN14557.1 hypothetical protein LFM56_17125 [Cellulomonas iranensis]